MKAWQKRAQQFRIEAEKLNQQSTPIKLPSIIQFCENLKLGLDNFSFDNRQFLKEIILDDSEEITVLKSRQVGFTVLQAAIMAYYALKEPGIRIMYCSYQQKHMRYISKSLLRPFLKSQLELKKSEESIESYFLPNGSIITLISGSNSFSQAKGYPINLLCIDEAEALQLEELPVILETMAAQRFKKVIMGGTGGAEGTEWERLWKLTNQKTWEDNTWHSNTDSTRNGYHITQRMMPFWSQEYEDAKRLKYNPIKFATEVLGQFALHSDIPLDIRTVKSCMYDGDWQEPRFNNIIASLDLAAGGSADTILTISQLNDDKVDVLYSMASNDKLSDDIISKLLPILHRYNPNYVVSDAGGNMELLEKLRQQYTVQAYSLGATNDPIKYNDTDTWAVNKSFMLQRTITRFHNGNISLPHKEWLIDQLTSEVAQTKQKKNGGSFIEFDKMPDRKDDFLMSLVFLECFIYSKSDENNPKNKQVGWTVV